MPVRNSLDLSTTELDVRPRRHSSALVFVLGAVVLGATLFGAAGASVHGDESSHWAYRRLAPVALPNVRQVDRMLTPVDRFVAARQEANGAELARAADDDTLLRRLTLDLTGLPPTIDERRDFLADRGPDRVERLVDRLLASPQHGPRWARFWLDAAGYADSNGYFSADTDRPLAFQYRDYIVRAHNADRPFDQVVREQIAGDELSGYDPSKSVNDTTIDALIATHFLRNAPDGTGESDGNPDEVRVDRYTVLEGTLAIVGSSLLALTVQCAKCHDHKFEPFTQREYYQLQSLIYPAYNVEQWVKPNDRQAQVGERKIAWLSDLAATPPEVALLVRGDPKQRGELVNPDVPAALRDERAPFRVEPPPARRTTGRRMAFANWLTQPGSRAASLVARVTANRVWQHHFGVGIVETPGNFGLTGANPSHPELLEYLAQRLVETGWSLKHTHREIVLSATYRQATDASPSVERIDPRNQLLTRYPLRRLDADAIRDGLLAASGELDLTLDGPFVATKRNGQGEVAVEPNAAGFRRRSLYLQQRRTQLDSFLAVFDQPSIVATCARRPLTTTPLQSLAQLNSSFMRGRAEQLAATLVHDSFRAVAAEFAPREALDEARWTHAFLLACGREPAEAERVAAREFLAAQRPEYSGDADTARRVWTDACQMLLASHAFLYLE